MRRMLAITAALVGLAQSTAAQSTAAPPASAPTTAPTPTTTPTPTPVAPTPAVVAQPAPAPTPTPVPTASPPRSRRAQLYTWGSVGTTFAYGETYGSANVGVGYLMQRGITPNLEVSYMFGSSPTIWAFKPGVLWFIPAPKLRPYVGAYYTHWAVSSGFPDENGLGARVGFSLGPVISLGLTYDHVLGCSANCDMWTPQVSAGLSL